MPLFGSLFSPDLIYRIPALIIALSFHEFAHAYAATRLGDPTPRLTGRLTLNPLAHLDPIGLLMLWLVRFGWGKPVQVNPAYFDDREKGMMLVSLAGPGANILIALIAAVALHAWPFRMTQTVFILFREIIFLDVFLAVFNLIPIPPLDGSKVLFGILPPRYAYQYYGFLEQFGPMILLLLVFTGLIGTILGPLGLFVARIIEWIASTIVFW